MALNAISDAFFYLDTELKDRKVARPAGYAQCDKPTCLEALESPYAGASKRHVRNNLEGFRRFFHGCGEGAEGVSLDDLLGALGAGDLSTRISQATDRAMAALDTLPEGDFSDALAQRPETMRAFYDRLRELVTLLRTEFVSILDLELPKRLEGDND
jgi:hypothetical protein